MSDTWTAIQEVKIRQSSMRERLAKRKKDRQDLLNLTAEEPDPAKRIKKEKDSYLSYNTDESNDGITNPLSDTSKPSRIHLIYRKLNLIPPPQMKIF